MSILRLCIASGLASMVIAAHAEPAEAPIASWVGRMTLEQKLAQLVMAADGSAAAATAGFVLAAPGSRRRPAGRAQPAIPPLRVARALPAETPGPLALAATWRPSLARDAGRAAAASLRAEGFAMVLGPSAEVVRDLRRGAVESTFGEDPFLVAEMARAMLAGLQGDAAAGGIGPGGVIAALGGYAGPAPATAASGAGPLPIAPRELHEVALAPFWALLEARPQAAHAIVASRSQLDAVPAHANPGLLRRTLRDEGGFAGIVLADPQGIDDLHRSYRVAASRSDAAVLALNSGIDAGLPSGVRLRPALRDGRLMPERLDAAVARVLALKRIAGLPGGAAPRGQRLTSAGDRTALEAARQAITLLKNDGTLPLAATPQPRLVVFADGRRDGWSLQLRRALSASADVTLATTLRGTLRAARDGRPVIVAAAAPAQELLAALKSRGHRVVVVLTGHPAALGADTAERADALLAAWSLGPAGAHAVADVLLGRVNPGGKLPLTLPRSAGHLPSFHAVKPSARRGYLFDTAEPLFPFGWGLSYTRFEIAPPKLSVPTIEIDGQVDVEVSVRNRGDRSGDETVQLYVRDRLATVTQPLRRLVAFERVTLAAGEQRTLHFTIAARRLAIGDGPSRQRVEPGEFDVLAGPDSARLQGAMLTVADGAAR